MNPDQYLGLLYNPDEAERYRQEVERRRRREQQQANDPTAALAAMLGGGPAQSGPSPIGIQQLLAGGATAPAPTPSVDRQSTLLGQFDQAPETFTEAAARRQILLNSGLLPTPASSAPDSAQRKAAVDSARGSNLLSYATAPLDAGLALYDDATTRLSRIPAGMAGGIAAGAGKVFGFDVNRKAVEEKTGGFFKALTQINPVGLTGIARREVEKVAEGTAVGEFLPSQDEQARRTAAILNSGAGRFMTGLYSGLLGEAATNIGNLVSSDNVADVSKRFYGVEDTEQSLGSAFGVGSILGNIGQIAATGGAGSAAIKAGAARAAAQGSRVGQLLNANVNIGKAGGLINRALGSATTGQLLAYGAAQGGSAFARDAADYNEGKIGMGTLLAGTAIEGAVGALGVGGDGLGSFAKKVMFDVAANAAGSATKNALPYALDGKKFSAEEYATKVGVESLFGVGGAILGRGLERLLGGAVPQGTELPSSGMAPLRLGAGPEAIPLEAMAMPPRNPDGSIPMPQGMTPLLPEAPQSQAPSLEAPASAAPVTKQAAEFGLGSRIAKMIEGPDAQAKYDMIFRAATGQSRSGDDQVDSALLRAAMEGKSVPMTLRSGIETDPDVPNPTMPTEALKAMREVEVESYTNALLDVPQQPVTPQSPIAVYTANEATKQAHIQLVGQALGLKPNEFGQYSIQQIRSKVRADGVIASNRALKQAGIGIEEIPDAPTATPLTSTQIAPEPTMEAQAIPEPIPDPVNPTGDPIPAQPDVIADPVNPTGEPAAPVVSDVIPSLPAGTMDPILPIQDPVELPPVVQAVDQVSPIMTGDVNPSIPLPRAQEFFETADGGVTSLTATSTADVTPETEIPIATGTEVRVAESDATIARLSETTRGPVVGEAVTLDPVPASQAEVEAEAVMRDVEVEASVATEKPQEFEVLPAVRREELSDAEVSNRLIRRVKEVRDVISNDSQYGGMMAKFKRSGLIVEEEGVEYFEMPDGNGGTAMVSADTVQAILIGPDGPDLRQWLSTVGGRAIADEIVSAARQVKEAAGGAKNAGELLHGLMVAQSNRTSAKQLVSDIRETLSATRKFTLPETNQGRPSVIEKIAYGFLPEQSRNRSDVRALAASSPGGYDAGFVRVYETETGSVEVEFSPELSRALLNQIEDGVSAGRVAPVGASAVEVFGNDVEVGDRAFSIADASDDRLAMADVELSYADVKKEIDRTWGGQLGQRIMNSPMFKQLFPDGINGSLSQAVENAPNSAAAMTIIDNVTRAANDLYKGRPGVQLREFYDKVGQLADQVAQNFDSAKTQLDASLAMKKIFPIPKASIGRRFLSDYKQVAQQFRRVFSEQGKPDPKSWTDAEWAQVFDAIPKNDRQKYEQMARQDYIQQVKEKLRAAIDSRGENLEQGSRGVSQTFLGRIVDKQELESLAGRNVVGTLQRTIDNPLSTSEKLIERRVREAIEARDSRPLAPGETRLTDAEIRQQEIDDIRSGAEIALDLMNGGGKPGSKRFRNSVAVTAALVAFGKGATASAATVASEEIDPDETYFGISGGALATILAITGGAAFYSLRKKGGPNLFNKVLPFLTDRLADNSALKSFIYSGTEMLNPGKRRLAQTEQSVRDAISQQLDSSGNRQFPDGSKEFSDEFSRRMKLNEEMSRGINGFVAFHHMAKRNPWIKKIQDVTRASDRELRKVSSEVGRITNTIRNGDHLAAAGIKMTGKELTEHRNMVARKYIAMENILSDLRSGAIGRQEFDSMFNADGTIAFPPEGYTPKYGSGEMPIDPADLAASAKKLKSAMENGWFSNTDKLTYDLMKRQRTLTSTTQLRGVLERTLNIKSTAELDSATGTYRFPEVERIRAEEASVIDVLKLEAERLDVDRQAALQVGDKKTARQLANQILEIETSISSRNNRLAQIQEWYSLVESSELFGYIPHTHLMKGEYQITYREVNPDFDAKFNAVSARLEQVKKAPNADPKVIKTLERQKAALAADARTTRTARFATVTELENFKKKNGLYDKGNEWRILNENDGKPLSNENGWKTKTLTTLLQLAGSRVLMLGDEAQIIAKIMGDPNLSHINERGLWAVKRALEKNDGAYDPEEAAALIRGMFDPNISFLARRRNIRGWEPELGKEFDFFESGMDEMMTNGQQAIFTSRQLNIGREVMEGIESLGLGDNQLHTYLSQWVDHLVSPATGRSEAAKRMVNAARKAGLFSALALNVKQIFKNSALASPALVAETWSTNTLRRQAQGNGAFNSLTKGLFETIVDIGTAAGGALSGGRVLSESNRKLYRMLIDDYDVASSEYIKHATDGVEGAFFGSKAFNVMMFATRWAESFVNKTASMAAARSALRANPADMDGAIDAALEARASINGDFRLEQKSKWERQLSKTTLGPLTTVLMSAATQSMSQFFTLAGRIADQDTASKKVAALLAGPAAWAGIAVFLGGVKNVPLAGDVIAITDFFDSLANQDDEDLRGRLLRQNSREKWEKRTIEMLGRVGFAEDTSRFIWSVFEAGAVTEMTGRSFQQENTVGSLLDPLLLSKTQEAAKYIPKIASDGLTLETTLQGLSFFNSGLHQTARAVIQFQKGEVIDKSGIGRGRTYDGFDAMAEFLLGRSYEDLEAARNRFTKAGTLNDYADIASYRKSLTAIKGFKILGGEASERLFDIRAREIQQDAALMFENPRFQRFMKDGVSQADAIIESPQMERILQELARQGGAAYGNDKNYSRIKEDLRRAVTNHYAAIAMRLATAKHGVPTEYAGVEKTPIFIVAESLMKRMENSMTSGVYNGMIYDSYVGRSI